MLLNSEGEYVKIKWYAAIIYQEFLIEFAKFTINTTVFLTVKSTVLRQS